MYEYIQLSFSLLTSSYQTRGQHLQSSKKLWTVQDLGHLWQCPADPGHPPPAGPCEHHLWTTRHHDVKKTMGLKWSSCSLSFHKIYNLTLNNTKTHTHTHTHTYGTIGHSGLDLYHVPVVVATTWRHHKSCLGVKLDREDHMAILESYTEELILK